ncbi:hypothetical protein Tco_1513216, partial [Tanacetum coccineum]
MLDILGNLLKLLDVLVDENVLPITYGKLKPPLGTHRLKGLKFGRIRPLGMSIHCEAADPNG